MKRMFLCLLSLILLSGCIAQGASVNGLDALKKQSQSTLDTIIMHQALDAQKKRTSLDYSVQVALTSGPVLTLLMNEAGFTNRLIVHADNHTQWIQIFEDRILCLTGDDGAIHAELLEDLSGYGDIQTIVECVSDPMSLVENRSFQRTSGAEEGSLQIATDNIDFWMKVSSDGLLEQLRLYLSDTPMMTATYFSESPLFPNVEITDYPAYYDFLMMSEDLLIEKGFVKEESKYVRTTEHGSEVLIFTDSLLDYRVQSETETLRLIYDELVLTGIYADEPLENYCEVILQGEKEMNEETRCQTKETKVLEKLFEKLVEEFPNT